MNAPIAPSIELYIFSFWSFFLILAVLSSKDKNCNKVITSGLLEGLKVSAFLSTFSEMEVAFGYVA